MNANRLNSKCSESSMVAMLVPTESLTGMKRGGREKETAGWRGKRDVVTNRISRKPSGQVENLLNQLRVKSDEIAKLHKQIAKLEANHAKYIASVKTLAVASLKTSSNFVPDLDTSTTNRTTSPSRTDSSFSTASPFRSGSPIKKSAERSEPVKVVSISSTVPSLPLLPLPLLPVYFLLISYFLQ